MGYTGLEPLAGQSGKAGERRPPSDQTNAPDLRLSPAVRGEVRADTQPKPKPSMTFLVLGFSSLDMSLCVLLYTLSCVFLMVVFFFFRMRSKRWKLKHSRLYV